MHAIMELMSEVTDGHCGYCQKKEKKALGEVEEPEEKGNSHALGLWAHSLTAAKYQALLDCGWRRSGKYVYKPVMEKTCCPQYTIRLDSHKFFLSRSQRRVLRVMSDYLKNDVKPKSGPVQEMDTSPIDSTENNNAETMDKSEEAQKRDHNDNPVQKKKEKRRERCFKKWAEKGLDVEEMKRQRREREEGRRRTIESYLMEADGNWKHRMEVRLVSVSGEAIKEREEESFQLYRKYQMTIHNDDDPSRAGHKRFLMDSPLETPDVAYPPNMPPYGSYHQWYLLDDKLIAVGVVDILPRCVSSKYMYYDPDFNFLSLGTYTALREIDFTKQLSSVRSELKYYYMGYYIQSCPKMRYKGKFQPSDLLCEKSLTWMPLSDCSKLFSTSPQPFVVFHPDAVVPRKTRQDLVILLNGRAVRYRDLGEMIPSYFEVETPAEREKLDKVAGYLAGDVLQSKFYLFVNSIYRLYREESSDSDA